MAEVAVDERRLLKTMRWYDGVVIGLANPGFLRPCHGIRLPSDHYLHLYAANLGRGPDGTFWCLGDRAQAPSGAGYALENRIVLSLMLPDVFHDCRVQRLALFFRTLRDSLRVIAPHNTPTAI